ncbi:MAG: molecular chaperone Tir [Burkholderiaceae bacterium]
MSEIQDLAHDDATGHDVDPNHERYLQLVRELCAALDRPDAESVIAARRIEVEGFDVVLAHVENDPEAMYLQFDYGVTTAGRTLSILRLMLESNLLVYAQDQAQLGLDPDTGSSQLIVRVAMTADIDGPWLSETLSHYAEHGRYWRDHLLQAPDEMFEALSVGDWLWLRA